MNQTYKYRFENGKLIKTDQDGNEISSLSLRDPDATSTSTSSAGACVSEAASESSAGFNPRNTTNLGGNTSIQDELMADADDPSDPEHVYPPPNDDNNDQNDQRKRMLDAGIETLAQRDKEAVRFSQNLLSEGDTLVYILYPGKAYDRTGFCISDQVHRVHSSKLLATGSEKFKELLSPTKQFRTLRKKHINLANRLPPGIKFVLDLTPPDEGDEAVELTASLSCSYGICQWYSARERLSVSAGLVSGEDETLSSPRQQRKGSSGESHNSNEGEYTGNYNVASNETYTDARNPVHSSQTWNPIPAPRSGAQADQDLANAIRASTVTSSTLPSVRKNWKYREVPEYDSVRHRVGIVRLLQVLEGKDARLDSAPKVWTLLALAQYFDCTPAVVDWIVMWMIADPNSRIIEILPEAACKIGFGLQSTLIARSAFAILVGEEALSLVSRSEGKYLADQKGTNQFGRRTESIDEDLKTRIEYASKAFVDRINKRFNNLLNPYCPYFSHVNPSLNYERPLQFPKLDDFRDAIRASSAPLREEAQGWLDAVENLKVKLRHWIRGSIVRVLCDDLSFELRTTSDKSRLAEDYGAISDPTRMGKTYHSLSSNERLMTSFFWRMLMNMQAKVGEIEWDSPFMANFNMTDDKQDLLASAHGIEFVSRNELVDARDRFNIAVLEAILAGKYEDGVVPLKCWDAARYSASLEKRSSINSVNNPTMSDARILDSDDEEGSLNPAPPLDEFFNSRPAAPSYGNPTSSLPFRDFPAESATSTSRETETADLVGLGSGSRKRQKVLRFANQDRNTSTISRNQSQVSSILATAPSIPQAKLHNANSEVFGTKPEEVLPHHNRGNASRTTQQRAQSDGLVPQVPHENDIELHSIFFHLERFLGDVQVHIDSVCASVLSKSEIGIDIELTDTLVSLAPMEYKYLPLWAGGDDDGSGGVFNEDIPTAVGGPSGPGPAFHTGFSIPSHSSTRSESSFDTVSQMTSKGTSQMALDGFSDALPRNRVVSDDGFHSEGFSDCDSDIWDEIGKGKHRMYATPSVTARSESTMDNDFASSDGRSEAGTATGYDFLSSSEGTDDAEIVEQNMARNNTAVEDEDFSDGDEEAFDFGDDDLMDAAE